MFEKESRDQKLHKKIKKTVEEKSFSRKKNEIKSVEEVRKIISNLFVIIALFELT